MPRISVCITCYNHEHYIAQCLSSALNQSGDLELEILVGDDGSSDRTRAIISEFAARTPDVIKPVFHPQNLGASGNLQTLIMLATGDFIAHLDGDDYWSPNKLQRQLALLAEHPDAMAVYCNARVVTPEDEILGYFNDVVPAAFELDYLLKCGNFLNHSSLVYRREGARPLLAIKGDFIDYRVHVNLAALGSLLYVDEALVGYRWMVSNSMTNSTRDPIYQRYLHAIEDASSLGASQNAIDLCLQRFWRSIIYSAIWPPNLPRLSRFYGLIRRSANLHQSRCQLMSYSLLSVIQLPSVALRHGIGEVTHDKTFFPTGHHSA
jgi:glycosyltransferase involved in cell wall biosynthesis